MSNSSNLQLLSTVEVLAACDKEKWYWDDVVIKWEFLPLTKFRNFQLYKITLVCSQRFAGLAPSPGSRELFIQNQILDCWLRKAQQILYWKLGYYYFCDVIMIDGDAIVTGVIGL